MTIIEVRRSTHQSAHRTVQKGSQLRHTYCFTGFSNVHTYCTCYQYNDVYPSMERIAVCRSTWGGRRYAPGTIVCTTPTILKSFTTYYFAGFCNVSVTYFYQWTRHPARHIIGLWESFLRYMLLYDTELQPHNIPYDSLSAFTIWPAATEILKQLTRSHNYFSFRCIYLPLLRTKQHEASVIFSLDHISYRQQLSCPERCYLLESR